MNLKTKIGLVAIATTASLQNSASWSTAQVWRWSFFRPSLQCWKYLICPHNARYHKQPVLKVLSFRFDKGLLAPLVYRLVNNMVCSQTARTSTSRCFWAMSRTGSCMLLYAAPSLVLNCVKVWTDWRPQIQWNEVGCFLTQELDCGTCRVDRYDTGALACR